MAKVHVQYDTNDKTATCTVDGKELPDVHSVRLDRRYGDNDKEPKFYLEMHQMTKDEEHDTVKHQHTVASQFVPAGAKDVKDADGLSGHKTVTTTAPARSVVEQIVDFLVEG